MSQSPPWLLDTVPHIYAIDYKSLHHLFPALRHLNLVEIFQETRRLSL